MKKAALLLCMALVWGCDDSSNGDFDCGHGSLNGGACQCETGYKYDVNQSCTVCADGYLKNESGICVKKDAEEPGDSGNTGDATCKTTFHYFNEWSSTGACGEADFDVYLIGSFNDWKEADPAYKMTSNGDGSHSITVDLKKGEGYVYKYYINGWAENSYQDEPAASDRDSEGNALANIQACGLTFGTRSGSKSCGGNPDVPDNPDDITCKTTFHYYNEWSNTGACGEADFDVYLIGSFNDWKEADPAYKMTSNGDGSHSITVEWKKGSDYTYKYYIDGWGENSYQAEPSTSEYDPDGNAYARITSCDMTFGTRSGNKSCGDNPDIPDEPDDGKCRTTFHYFNEWSNTGACGVENFDVYLIGSFNDWKEADPAYKMTSNGDGSHSITVEWTEGSEYTYKYYINGWAENSYQAEPATSEYDQDGNAYARITSCGMTIGTRSGSLSCGGGGGGGGGDVTSNEGINLAGKPSVSGKNIEFTVNLESGWSISEVKGGSGSASFDGTKVTDTVPENNRYNYRVMATNGSKTSELYVPVWVEDKAFDWHDALLYFAFTDRFYNGDTSNDRKSNVTSNSAAADWYGGDFAGLKKKVEEGYFTALGVNTLWISSVSMNTQDISYGSNGDTHSYSAYHSYWPVTTFMTANNQSEFTSAESKGVKLTAIEPHFGTMEELQALVEACHKRGIRVLVDFAANHVHKDSPMYTKHKDWFNGTGQPGELCDNNNNWDNNPETCWFSADLPDINFNNADARKLMVEHAVWLIKETGVDGFRVDAVKHIAIQFIKDLRAATDALFANTGIMFYMVGETFTGDVGLLNKYIGDDLLHAQFDFPLYYKLGNVLAGNGLYDLAANYNVTFKSDLMGTFMGNHDVARAISVANGDNTGKWGNNPTPTSWDAYNRMMAAWTILLTRPGVPLIYYGDEYGMPGSNDPDNRRMMQFDGLNEQQVAMLDYVKNLGVMRSEHKALSRGSIETLSLSNTTWCYKREYDGETLIVGVGLKTKDNVQPGTCNLKKTYALKNLFDGTELSTSSLDLSGNKFQIYQVK